MLTTTTRSLPDALADPAAYPHAPGRGRIARDPHLLDLPGRRTRSTRSRSRSSSRSWTTARPPCAGEPCHAEVELGRRFAPSVYRDVVAISPRPDGGLQITPEQDSRAIDYAVRDAPL